MLPSRFVTIALSLLLAVYVGLLARGIGKPDGWLIDDKGRAQSYDYVALWAAGRLTLEGSPRKAYDWKEHQQAQNRGLGYDSPDRYPIAYPPTYLMLMAPFAALPYIPSMLVFVTLTAGLVGWAGARIAGRPEGALWALATTATFWNLGVGQNAFLTAGLLGAGLALLPTRQIAAGVAFGLLSWKPHLGLLLPVALAAAGYWRAFLAAAFTALAMALLCYLALGIETWSAWLASAREFTQAIMTDYKRPFRLQSLFGVLATWKVPSAYALLAQNALVVTLAAGTFFLWRSAAPYALKAAALATATLLLSPYLFIYDLMALAVAQTFLIRHGLDEGNLDHVDIGAIVLANLLVLAFPFALFPTGFLAAIVLALAIGRRMTGQKHLPAPNRATAMGRA